MTWSRAAAATLPFVLAVAAVGCPSEPVAEPCPPACGGEAGQGGAGGGADSCPLGDGEPLRAVGISVIFDSVAVLLSNGSVICWGSDVTFRQCGGAGYYLEPALAKGPACVVSAERGAPMGAGLTWDGRVQIWGPETDNSAGDGPGPGPAFGESAIVALPTDERVVWVSPSTPAVAITESGAVYMWGDESFGTVPGTSVELPVPTLYPLPQPAVMSGQDSHCILDVVGDVYCFGSNGRGKLGLEELDHNGQFEPVRIDIVDVTWISEESDYVCALRSDGSVWCWGDNYLAKAGQPYPADELHVMPLRVEGLPPLAKVFTGLNATCGIDADSRAWCWGNVYFGKNMFPPDTWAEDLRFVDIGLGDGFACGVVDDGRVYCRGLSGACYGPPPQSTNCFVDLSAVYAELGQP